MNMAPRLHTVIASTRPTRVGPGVAKWFHEFAAKDGQFDAHLVDLAEFELPILDEPVHPARRHYQHEHTKRWSESVDKADALVFVTPEYNYGPPPSLLNALDYLFWEWQYKAVGLVGYGGISGGGRSTHAIKPTIVSLKMMPIPETVWLPNVFQQLKDGLFTANEFNEQGASALLNELIKWTDALAPLRDQTRAQLKQQA
jgi:NAD(P)H-dependent FMN reductase